MINEILLQFDGGSRGNPGLAGGGVVIYENKEEIVSGCIPITQSTTNNQAEYLALKEGLLLALNEGYKEITVQGDSMLVINQVNGLWKVKNKELKIIHSEIVNLIKCFDKVILEHIYRKHNKRADELANQAMDLLTLNLKT